MQAIQPSADTAYPPFVPGNKYTAISTFNQSGLPTYVTELRIGDIACNPAEGVFQNNHPLIHSAIKINIPFGLAQEIQAIATQKLALEQQQKALQKREEALKPVIQQFLGEPSFP